MESFCVSEKINQTQYLVSDSYIQTLYVVKWFCVNFYKESLRSQEGEYFFCASNLRGKYLAF